MRMYNGIQTQDLGKRGFTLVEVATATSVFTVIALAVSVALMRGMEHRRQSFLRYRALNALRDMVAKIQETANLPQDLPNQIGIGAVYPCYHDQTLTVPDLPSGEVSITCFADENTVPAELGGPQDLNYDGDALDNLANVSNGSDLKLVPMTLTLTFTEGGVDSSLTMNRLLTKTTN